MRLSNFLIIFYTSFNNNTLWKMLISSKDIRYTKFYEVTIATKNDDNSEKKIIPLPIHLN